MNLDSLSFALSHISYSVANLTKKNFKSSVQEVSRLVAQHGLEAEKHLLRCLFSHVDFSGDGKSSGKDFHQTQYLIQECASLISKPNFVSLFCYAVDSPLHQQKSLKPSAHLLPQLSKVLKLNCVQEVAFGLALLQSSNSDLHQHTLQFVKQKIPDFLKLITEPDTNLGLESSLKDSDPEVFQLFLNYLFCYPNDDIGITIEQREALINLLKKDFSCEISTILIPHLFSDKFDSKMDSSISNSSSMQKSDDDSFAEVIKEIGYSFTSSIEECRNNAMQIGLKDVTPCIVARILSMMARTPIGLTDPVSLQNMNSNSIVVWNDSKEKAEGNQQSWNTEIFVQVMHEMCLSPQLQRIKQIMMIPLEYL